MILKYSLFTFVFILNWNFSFAQTTRIERAVGKTSNSNNPVTAIAIKSVTNQGEEIKVKIDFDTLNIPLDSDAPEFTYFTSFSKKYEDIEVQVLAPGEFEINLINSGNTPTISHSKKRHTQDDCEYDFSVINQEEWRTGLAAPSYSRSFSDVNHVVIHHSAGSNSNTNYTQVIRDIYIYHTEVNGWSDIGYNYLIAQNGDIYAGRDPDSGEQDNVRGAHFCGGNTGTMGVCLLGNYETTTPTIETWNSLQEVVSFKVQKENLDPLGSASHSLGEISTIAGHRDGCSTLCPGENVYSQLAELRIDIEDSFDNCNERHLGFTANTRSPKAFDDVVFSNESFGYDSYAWVLEGGHSDSTFWLKTGSTYYTQSGFYNVTLVGLVNNLYLDTLMKESYIEVVDGSIIYPNPVSNNTIYIRSEIEGQKVSLYSLGGKEYDLQSSDSENSFTIPEIEAGIYLLKIPTSKGVREEKLLVQ